MNSGGSRPRDAHEHGVHLQACVLPSAIHRPCCLSAPASRSHPLVSEHAAARLQTLEIPACITYPLPCHCGETSHSSGTKPPPVSGTEHTTKHAHSSPCPGPISCKSRASKMSLKRQKVQELHRLVEMGVCGARSPWRCCSLCTSLTAASAGPQGRSNTQVAFSQITYGFLQITYLFFL